MFSSWIDATGCPWRLCAGLCYHGGCVFYVVFVVLLSTLVVLSLFFFIQWSLFPLLVYLYMPVYSDLLVSSFVSLLIYPISYI